jgi:hypothetical protein
MINFDRLPNSNPSGSFYVPDGKYHAIVEKAEMRQPKDPVKPMYLSLTWKVFDQNNKVLGFMFDNLVESESPYVLFKIKSFIEATGLNMGNEFELKDLAKVCKGKHCILTLIKDRNAQDDRSVINIFAAHPYDKFIASPVDVEDLPPFDGIADDAY